jgi:hypothetical protein
MLASRAPMALGERAAAPSRPARSAALPVAARARASAAPTGSTPRPCSSSASAAPAPTCAARPSTTRRPASGRARLSHLAARAASSPNAPPFKTKDARLVLEDGSVWRAAAFGAPAGGDGVVGEVVFNTSMTGYQEIMTDPSYKGQFVVFTYPHIGNTGINFGERGWCWEQSRGGLCRALCSLEERPTPPRRAPRALPRSPAPSRPQTKLPRPPPPKQRTSSRPSATWAPSS